MFLGIGVEDKLISHLFLISNKESGISEKEEGSILISNSLLFVLWCEYNESREIL